MKFAIGKVSFVKSTKLPFHDNDDDVVVGRDKVETTYFKISCIDELIFVDLSSSSSLLFSVDDDDNNV